jgi:hypothetical protein
LPHFPFPPIFFLFFPPFFTFPSSYPTIHLLPLPTPHSPLTE